MRRTPVQRAGRDDGVETWVYDDVTHEHDHQDPVLSMHDTEAEAGDEVGLADLYRMDTLEAEQAGVALDPASDQEATLD